MKKVIQFGQEPGDYVVVLRYREDPTWVDWKLIEITGIAPECLLYSLAGSLDRAPTSNIDAAEAEASGYCKLDGCMEISLNTHLCDARGLAKLLDAIKRVYVECAKITGFRLE